MRKLNIDAKKLKAKSASPRTGPTFMTHRHVLKTIAKGKLCFRAVVRERNSRKKVYLGTTASVKEAADLAAEYLRTPVEDLSRKKAWRESAEESCGRVSALLKAFQGWVPADLASSIEFRRASGHMQEQAPAAYVAGLFGKEAPWKRALANVWAHHV